MNDPKPCDVCEDKPECMFENWPPCKEVIDWKELPQEDRIAHADYQGKGTPIFQKQSDASYRRGGTNSFGNRKIDY